MTPGVPSIALPTIVVVPCYNEAERLQHEPFLAAANAQPSLSFLLVDDGSKDATRASLELLRQRGGAQFGVLGLDHNRGKAEAVRQGVLAACARAPALVAYFDADLATPLSELEGMCALFAARPELQLAFGSRVGLLGHDVIRSPGRHYLGRSFATLASMGLALPIYDTQCGAKVFRNTAPVRELFARPFRTRWIFDVEILARSMALAQAGTLPPLSRCAAEYPLRRWRDVAGSKLKARAALGSGLELARLCLQYRNSSRRPGPASLGN